MSVRRSLLATATIATVLGSSGCAALTGEGDDGSAKGSHTIAVGLYPLQYVAERVAGDAFDVVNLTTPGGEPHDLELGVTQAAEIADAALVVYVGSLQPAVDDAVAEKSSGQSLDAASVVDLRTFEEEDEGEHEHEHDESDDDHHDHGEYDPHFWQDPLRMASLGDAVADELAEIDPDQASTFEANAEELRSDLEALDEEYATGLADCQITTIVTNHDAFGYLEKYGLHVAPVTGISPDAEPSPADLADLQDLIRAQGITTLFSESLLSPDTVETLAKDVGVSTEVLDTIEGLTDETADEDYLSLMRSNLAKLEKANRC